ncbi:MAG: hypothetical protein QM658_03440 [Gordonia sp. (in: high G+C Gram-positive bacteria)]
MTAPVINIQTGAGEIVRIVATLLLCGAVGMVGWALAEAGWLEVASTAVTMFAMQLMLLSARAGIIALPAKSGEESFAETKGIVRKVAAEYTAWLGRSNMLRLALIALAYTVGFLLVRQGVSAALTVFSNMWIAGAASAALASIIIAPKLVPGIFAGLKSKGVVTTGRPPAQEAPAPVTMTDQSSARPEPVATPAPVAAPVPTTDNEAPIVMRRKTKKEA